MRARSDRFFSRAAALSFMRFFALLILGMGRSASGFSSV
jgi:hypothetical protein